MLFQSLQDDSGEDLPVPDTGQAVGTNEKDSLAAKLVAIEVSATEPIAASPLVDPVEANSTQDANAANELVITRLFEVYNHRICTFLGHMVGNEETGCDLAQETFIRAWKALPSLRHPSQTEAWLFRTARNIAIDYLRKKLLKGVLPWTKMEEHEATGNLKAGGFEEQVSEQECVKQALAHLRPKLRACLILYVIVGLSQKKIAEILHLNETSVTTYVSMGRKAFRQAYERLKEEKI
jgi:RNA polymerase sigma-70 factor (ECF subfamily)